MEGRWMEFSPSTNGKPVMNHANEISKGINLLAERLHPWAIYYLRKFKTRPIPVRVYNVGGGDGKC